MPAATQEANQWQRREDHPRLPSQRDPPGHAELRKCWGFPLALIRAPRGS